MTVMAFMYDTYYCWGLADNYKGVFETKEEALDSLVGNNYSKENLELIDVETKEFTRYLWETLYKQETIETPENYLELSSFNCDVNTKVKLTHNYDGTEIITTAWELNRGNGKYYHLVQAGRWNKI